MSFVACPPPVEANPRPRMKSIAGVFRVGNSLRMTERAGLPRTARGEAHFPPHFAASSCAAFFATSGGVR